MYANKNLKKRGARFGAKKLQRVLATHAQPKHRMHASAKWIKVSIKIRAHRKPEEKKRGKVARTGIKTSGNTCFYLKKILHGDRYPVCH